MQFLKRVIKKIENEERFSPIRFKPSFTYKWSDINERRIFSKRHCIRKSETFILRRIIRAITKINGNFQKSDDSHEDVEEWSKSKKLRIKVNVRRRINKNVTNSGIKG